MDSTQHQGQKTDSKPDLSCESTLPASSWWCEAAPPTPTVDPPELGHFGLSLSDASEQLAST